MSLVTRVLPLLLAATVAAACAPAGDGRAVALGPTTVPSASAEPADDVRGPAASATAEAGRTAGSSASRSASPSAAPSSAAPSAPSVAPPVAAARDPFAINLYRNGDFVPQYTFEWCVGASLQMMRNLTDARVTKARSTQQRYWELARDRSSSPFGGANPRGWTAVLNELGVGPYELVSIPDYDEALRVAARALRGTNRPVGLVMWRGRHAWVMSGFESRGDPRTVEDFTVTGIRVLDPLYPHGHSTWGPSPKPNSLLTPAKLARQFVSRDRFRVNLGVAPGYLLVLPVDATGAG